MTEPKAEIPPEIHENLQRWVWIANLLRFTQAVLGIVGTAAALSVTTFTAELGTFNTRVASFVAALCLGTLSAFNVGGKADSTRSAWRHLTHALLRYRTDSKYSIVELLTAYEDAEKMVGGVPFRTHVEVKSDEKSSDAAR